MNSTEPVKSGDAIKEVATILANGIIRMKKKEIQNNKNNSQQPLTKEGAY